MSQGFVQPIPLPLPVNNGGTGAITIPTALVNLGLGAPSGTGNVLFQTAPTINQPLINGVTNGSTAAAGQLGELISSVIAGTSTPLPAWSTPFAAASISCTAGCWLVFGNISLSCTVGGGIQAIVNWTQSGSGSAVIPDTSLYTSSNGANFTIAGLCVPTLIYNFSSTTTIKLCTYAQQGTGSGTVYTSGGLYAIRLR